MEPISRRVRRRILRNLQEPVSFSIEAESLVASPINHLVADMDPAYQDGCYADVQDKGVISGIKQLCNGR